MNIEDLKPGRELDILIGRALGWDVRQDPGPASGHFIISEWVGFGGTTGFTFSSPGQWYRITGEANELYPRADKLPNFSYDIRDAWTLAEHLRDAEPWKWFEISRRPVGWMANGTGDPKDSAYASTAPMTICLAFLKAKGVSSEMIDSGSPEAEARDRLAAVGFAEVERRMRKMRSALEEIANYVPVATNLNGVHVVPLEFMWALQRSARKAIE